MLPYNIKVLGKSLLFQQRFLSSPWRTLPHFLVIGAQKSGTTSLYNCLIQHPEIRPGLVKEVHYFDGGLNPEVDTYKKGAFWYRANFPLKGNGCITGEASPIYIFHPLVPGRIFELVPRVKLIALLRNPAERAISHFFHEKKKGREELPMLEAFKREEERLLPIIERQDYKNKIFKNKSYKTRGLYRQQLDRFLKYFSRKQILIISSEDFFNNTSSVLKKIFQFLEIEPAGNIFDLAPKNIGHNRVDAGKEVYDYLNDYFALPNRQLADLTGYDPGW
ncbi:MAG: sulfotransferase domain-containing protein [Desulfobacteraceae bacterium]|nr:sulfotransferase domain-containing protein [Desulfobacteraceae bacterium]